MTKGDSPINKTSTHDGLTKCEYFAAMAMHGVLSNPSLRFDIDDFVHDSVSLADALITELNKEK